jgi:hypothetical protein
LQLNTKNVFLQKNPKKTADTKQLYVVIKLDRLDKDIFNGGNYNQYTYYVIYIAVFLNSVTTITQVQFFLFYIKGGGGTAKFMMKHSKSMRKYNRPVVHS